jgi:hypothetical protein
MRLKKLLMSTLAFPVLVVLHCQRPASDPSTAPTSGGPTEQPAAPMPDMMVASQEPDMAAPDLAMLPDLSMPSCSAPSLMCGSQCIDPREDSAHCGGCGQTCSADHACVASTCVGSGSLQFSATWNRMGDGDLIVATPGGMMVSFANPGPNIGTEGGQMDRDDVAGTGPENVYWASTSTPPSGQYHVCFMTSSFTPLPSLTDPVHVTITVRWPGRAPMSFKKEFVANALSAGDCSPAEPTFVATIAYP